MILSKILNSKIVFHKFIKVIQKKKISVEKSCDKNYNIGIKSK